MGFPYFIINFERDLPGLLVALHSRHLFYTQETILASLLLVSQLMEGMQHKHHV
jgi:hypothetical protein